MLTKVNGRQELDRVNMLIRALADEMAEQRSENAGSSRQDALQTEMEEAMYELRLRKLLFVSLFQSRRIAERTARH